MSNLSWDYTDHKGEVIKIRTKYKDFPCDTVAKNPGGNASDTI